MQFHTNSTSWACFWHRYLCRHPTQEKERRDESEVKFRQVWFKIIFKQFFKCCLSKNFSKVGIIGISAISETRMIFDLLSIHLNWLKEIPGCSWVFFVVNNQIVIVSSLKSQVCSARFSPVETREITWWFDWLSQYFTYNILCKTTWNCS